MRSFHRAIGFAAVAAATALVVSGCSADVGQARPRTGAERTLESDTATKPVAVPGLDRCRSLEQRPGDPAAAGDRLPGLELDCLTAGPAITLSDLRGKPTVINLWATWCAPCRAEMPMLQSAFAGYDGAVQFLGVVTKDNPERAGSFLQEIGVTYPQVVDPAGALLAHLRIAGLPVTVVLDAEGGVVGKVVGPVDEERLKQLLDSAA